MPDCVDFNMSLLVVMQQYASGQASNLNVKLYGCLHRNVESTN